MLHLLTRLRSLILFSLFALPATGAYASHIVGADLYYAWVSGNTYKVTLALYADCGPASAAAYATLHLAVPKICVYNGSTYVDSFSLAIDAPSTGTEVTPTLCAGDTSQCTNMASAIPGITLFTYSGTYTLPATSTVWRFLFSGNMASASAGRATAITNLTGASTIELVDTLNNATSHNTNPILNIIPLPYYAVSMVHVYNPVAIDAEGDSLVYSLVAAQNGTSSCTAGGPVTYSSSTSATAPLQTLPGAFLFDSHSGQMFFYPNVLQRGVAVYNIREFRAGVLVGTIQREMTVLVNADTNHIPLGFYSAPTACTITDSVNVSVCDTTGAFSVHIHGSDADVTDTINMTALGLPTGATFTTSSLGTTSPMGVFSWNTTGLALGTYTFYVEYTDGACPMSGSQTLAYNVKVVHCTASTASVPAGIIAAVSGLKIFPNPSDGAFVIEAAEPFSNAAVTVTDVYGRVVKREYAPDNAKKMSMDLKHLADGAYMIKVVSGSRIYNEKISVHK